MPYSRVVLKRTITQYKTVIVEHGETDTPTTIGRKALETDNGQGYEARDERFKRRTHTVEPVDLTIRKE